MMMTFLPFQPRRFYRMRPALLGILFFFSAEHRAQVPIHRLPVEKEQFVKRTRSWQELILDPGASFFEVQKAFYAEWQGKPYEAGKGYKQFKRWEYLMQQRVNKAGFYDAAALAPAREFAGNTLRPVTERGGPDTDGQWTQTAQPAALNGPGQGGNLDEGAGIVYELEFHPANPDILFAASPTGGVWRSKNAGARWELASLSFASQAVYDVAVRPDQPDWILASTIAGVYRSEDGGDTWKFLTVSAPFSAPFQILAYNPSDPKQLIGVYGGNVWESNDHGASWAARAAFEGNCYDVEFKPGDPNTFYVATEQAIYRSTDKGKSLVDLKLPESQFGRREMAVTPAAPNNLYILTSNSAFYSNIFRSTDSGNSFKSIDFNGQIQQQGGIGGQCWHDLAIAVSDLNPDHILIGGVIMLATTDGGANWSSAMYDPGGRGSIHVDIQTLAYHPLTHQLYVGCDGGIYRSGGIGTPYAKLNKGLTNTQVYRMGQSPVESDAFIFGTQDNGSFQYDDRSFRWRLGGDGMDCAFAQDRPNRMLASFQLGFLMKSEDRGKNWSYLASSRALTGGDGPWISPQSFHPRNSNVILAGFYSIWKTTDFGATWAKTADASGPVLDLKFSPAQPNRVYALGSSNLFRSDDAGDNWSTIPLSPIYLYRIDAHPEEPDKIAGVSYGNVFKSNDGGKSWVSIAGSLPSVNISAVAYAGGPLDALYIGTDIGVFYRDNTLADWVFFSDGLSGTYINALEIDRIGGKIRAATYGIGLWESPLYPTAPPCSTGDVLSISPADKLDCAHRPALLQVSGPEELEYRWATTTGSIVDGANTRFPLVDGPGTYTVIARNPATGCTATATTSVEADFSPPELHPSAGAIGCSGAPVQLNPGYSAEGAAYFWVSTATGFNSTQPNPSVDKPADYTLVVTAPNGCTATKVLTVKTACTARFDISLSGSASNPNPGANANVSVSFTLTNHGTEAARNISVDFQKPLEGLIPAGIVQAFATQGFFPAPYYYWNAGDLAPGASATATFNFFTLDAQIKTVYGYVSYSESPDADSHPGKALPIFPVEDDEAAVRINAGQAGDCVVFGNAPTQCHDNETPDDPTDDTFGALVRIEASGGCTSNQWLSAEGYGGVFGQTVLSLINFPIRGGDTSLTVVDHGSLSARAKIILKAPPTCSGGQKDEPLPDLAVSDLSAPETLDAGGTADYRFELKNRGAVAAAGTYAIGLWLSRDRFPSADDRPLDTLLRSNTPEGASETIQGAFSIPANTAPGPYFLVLKADKNSRIEELGEFNNLENHPIRVPGCVIQYDIANTICQDNGTPENPDDDTWTVDVLLKAAPECTTTWTGGGKSGPYNIPATFGPFPIAEGFHNFVFTDSGDTNAVATFTAQPPFSCSTPALPDLILDNLKPSKNGAPGAVVEYTFDLLNKGKTPAVGDYVIGAWISGDKALDDSDVYVGYINTGNTPVGATPNVLGAVTIPAGFKPGDYHLVLKADKDNLIRELDERNNELSAFFQIDAASATDDPADPYRFRLFPNPARDRAVLTWDQALPQHSRVAVYNSLGVCVLRRHPGEAGRRTDFDLAHWPAGFYLVRVEWPGGGKGIWLEAAR